MFLVADETMFEKGYNIKLWTIIASLIGTGRAIKI